MNKILIIILLFLSITIFSKKTEIIKKALNISQIEVKLVQEFAKTKKNNKKISLELESLLIKEKSLSYDFKLLTKYINITESEDKSLRIFSWFSQKDKDYKNISSIIQFKGENNKVKIKKIDFKTVLYSAWINLKPSSYLKNKIHKIKIKNKDYYLSLANGTYNRGFHHSSILIFSIEKDDIKFCVNCIDKRYSLLKVPATYKIDLKYDEKTKTISFNDFRFLKRSNIALPTGKKVQLKLKDGKFIIIK